ncbi:hypothetical protein UCDDS831_g03641 [Diplodia seriata]|uniref:Glycoside hydrolase 131 catalytic N-terminal domain-containing protein n=1 Tax=Diplodia seriata TaxID=420778 RepID=A0A0G2EJV7_9PEZI|nr:hypothetical protein UCDDS831_g03641 [Diplodia seriata]
MSSLLVLLTTLACTSLAAPSPYRSVGYRPAYSNTRHRQINTTATPQCPILLDGRVPTNTTLTSFDVANDIFNPDYVKGNNVTWSQILEEPQGTLASKFDGAPEHRPIEVTINDDSIFQKQYGFRRAGLQFAADSANDTSDSGVVTLHWSVKQDWEKPLNLSHEYLNVWHEAADYSANQFNFNTGHRIGTNGTDKLSWQLLGRDSNLLWSTPIDFTNWQNFALTLDYVANTLTIYTSKNEEPLEEAGGPFTNDNSGAGQFQIGILKKPTGTDDVVNSGFQESNFKEGQIYGGIFVENSANGCISL